MPSRRFQSYILLVNCGEVLKTRVSPDLGKSCFFRTTIRRVSTRKYDGNYFQPGWLTIKAQFFFRGAKGPGRRRRRRRRRRKHPPQPNPLSSRPGMKYPVRHQTSLRLSRIFRLSGGGGHGRSYIYIYIEVRF